MCSEVSLRKMTSINGGAVVRNLRKNHKRKQLQKQHIQSRRQYGKQNKQAHLKILLDWLEQYCFPKTDSLFDVNSLHQLDQNMVTLQSNPVGELVVERSHSSIKS